MAYEIWITPDVSVIRHFGAYENGEGRFANAALLAHPDYQAGTPVIKDYSDSESAADYGIAVASEHAKSLIKVDQPFGPIRIGLVGEGDLVYGFLRQMVSLTLHSNVERGAFRSRQEACEWLGVDLQDQLVHERSTISNLS